MRISELIKECEKSLAEHGDIPIFVQSYSEDDQVHEIDLISVNHDADPLGEDELVIFVH